MIVGESRFWYKPAGYDDYITFGLGRRIMDRSGPSPMYRATTQAGFTGLETTTLYGGTAPIRLRHRWTRTPATGDGDTLRRALVGMIGHLRRGGCVAFAEDEDYAYAAFASPVQGKQRMNVDANLFAQHAGAPSSLVDREVWLQSEPDTYLFEHKQVQSVTTTSRIVEVRLTAPVHQDYTATRWQLLREYGSYPALRMPVDARISEDGLRHDREWYFELDLLLEDDPAELDRLAGTGEIPGSSGSDGPSGGGTGPVIDPGGSDTQVPDVPPWWGW